MEDYKKPDLKAPRFRKKTLGIITPGFIKRFKGKHPRYAEMTDKDLNKNMKLVMYSLGKKMRDEVINSRDGVDLPESLGSVFIGSCKGVFASDKKKSGELGKRVHHQNWHSDGLVCKVVYSNFDKRYRFANREIWSLVGIRDLTRDASVVYRADPFKYIRLDNIMNISKLYSKKLYKERKIQEENYLLDEYDEFHLR